VVKLGWPCILTVADSCYKGVKIGEAFSAVVGHQCPEF
jgi:hypothetical protein